MNTTTNHGQIRGPHNLSIEQQKVCLDNADIRNGYKQAV